MTTLQHRSSVGQFQEALGLGDSAGCNNTAHFKSQGSPHEISEHTRWLDEAGAQQAMDPGHAASQAHSSECLYLVLGWLQDNKLHEAHDALCREAGIEPGVACLAEFVSLPRILTDWKRAFICKFNGTPRLIVPTNQTAGSNDGSGGAAPPAAPSSATAMGASNTMAVGVMSRQASMHGGASQQQQQQQMQGGALLSAQAAAAQLAAGAAGQPMPVLARMMSSSSMAGNQVLNHMGPINRMSASGSLTQAAAPMSQPPQHPQPQPRQIVGGQQVTTCVGIAEGAVLGGTIVNGGGPGAAPTTLGIASLLGGVGGMKRDGLQPTRYLGTTSTGHQYMVADGGLGGGAFVTGQGMGQVDMWGGGGKDEGGAMSQSSSLVQGPGGGEEVSPMHAGRMMRGQVISAAGGMVMARSMGGGLHHAAPGSPSSGHHMGPVSGMGMDGEGDGGVSTTTSLTRLRGGSEPITQHTFLQVILTPNTLGRPVGELFEFKKPLRAYNAKKQSTRLQLADFQHDAMYALAGCTDVNFLISNIVRDVRAAMHHVYGIDKDSFNTWFKNRGRNPSKQGRPSKRRRGGPGGGGSPDSDWGNE